VTRKELAAFWDEQLDRWLQGKALDPILREWKAAWAGEVDEWAFPEPWMGPLLDKPRIVIGGLNPGRAHAELQSRRGRSARRVQEVGFTAWAAPRPFNISGAEWQEAGFGRIRLDEDRLTFARSFLRDPSVSFGSVLTLELYPWHSPGLGRHPIRVPPHILDEFILQPLSELADPRVPRVMFRRAWEVALGRLGDRARVAKTITGFAGRTRRADLWSVNQRGRFLVELHGQYDPLPHGSDLEVMRRAWFGVSTDRRRRTA